MAERPDARLIFSPKGSFTYPSLSLSSLTVPLRSKGVKAMQRHLSIELFDKLLTASALTAIVNDNKQRICQMCSKQPLEEDERKHLQLLRCTEVSSETVVEHIDEVRQNMRSEKEIYRKAKYIVARNLLQRAFEISSARYFPTLIAYNLSYAEV
jgi:hypothetical protein